MGKENIFDISLNFYKENISNNTRIKQLDILSNILQDNFEFITVRCIETGASQNINDGCVGIFFNKLTEISGGEFHTVDINENVINRSKDTYRSYNLKTNHHLKDSVKFLEETNFVPNLVHLDSYDLDLKNPLPSMLHTWREFKAIENKMPVGSIIIIDDNFFKGTWVSWNYPNGDSEKIDIEYPIVGKGSLIYHYVESDESNWVKLSEDTPGGNNKLVFKKINERK